jgi:RNA polymerase sigma factor (sigma-70 family)
VDSNRLKSDEAEVADLVNNFITSGDKKYWGMIFEKYKRNIYIQCYKILNNEEEAKDLTVDVFMRALDKFDMYDSHRLILPWLYSIAKHLCIDHIRKKQRFHFTQIAEEEITEIEEDPPDEEDPEQIKTRIRTAIDKLKRPQRTCFCLFYMQEKSYDEIAKLTGYSYNQVRSHIQNGRRKFKLILDRQ